MSLREWPADDYAIGAYIQAAAADIYLKDFKPKPTDYILDIGCGDASYSTKLLEFIPQGKMLGIDASENMLALARKTASHYPNLSIAKADVLSMDFHNQFDYAVSFWCLQWTDNIREAFHQIYEALRPGGKVFTLFPTGDDAYMRSYKAIKDSGKFKELADFKPPMHYHALENLEEKLKDLPFKKLTVHKTQHSIRLPSLDVFRRFIYGIGFYQGQVDAKSIPKINDAMINWYDAMCQREYNGEYWFKFTPYWVSGEK